MRYAITLILSLSTSIVFSQKSRDYIIKLNKDTVFTKVVRIDKEMTGVVCEEKDKKIKYEAKDVLILKNDTSYYEVGSINKEFIFLRRVIKGKLNLYELTTKQTKRSWKVLGRNLITFRWVYRAEDWSKKVPVTVYFYKKENESKENFSKFPKEKTQDCKLIQDKIKSEKWDPTPIELVRFYNKNCNNQ
jgi:hypothetical protein